MVFDRKTVRVVDKRKSECYNIQKWTGELMYFAEETLNFTAKANRDQIFGCMIDGCVRFSVFDSTIHFFERD